MKNPDNFGYYQVGELKFYSKLEAIKLHEKTNIHPHWNFNEDVYSAMDWTKEPAESLKELYKQRAQQLRNDYDYLVLWYSGGADSDNVLHAFIDNDIKLDEVASYINYEADSDKESFLNGEIFHVAAPKLDQLKEKYPDLIHRKIDISQLTFNAFNDSNRFDWIYHVNTAVTISSITRQNIQESVPEWKNMFDQGKSVAFIHGVDKPRVAQAATGEYIFRFIDTVDSLVTVRNQMLNRPWDNQEFFYWTPDAPKIVIKQAHILKKYLKTSTTTSRWISKTKSDLACKIVNGETWWISLEGIHSLIYPNWHPVPYQFKPISLILSPRDTWFYNLGDSESPRKIWKTGLEKRWNIVPDYWKNDVTDIKKGFKSSFSKEYSLGT
jgi:thiol-disulfide isomerase/thioredoxin